MSVPKLHQSTALPWPVLCSISGALGRDGVREERGREGGEKGGGGERTTNTSTQPRTQHSHVLYGPTEGVGSLVTEDGLLTEPKVRQDHMALLVEHYVLRLQVTVNDALFVEVS